MGVLQWINNLHFEVGQYVHTSVVMIFVISLSRHLVCVCVAVTEMKRQVSLVKTNSQDVGRKRTENVEINTEQSLKEGRITSAPEQSSLPRFW